MTAKTQHTAGGSGMIIDKKKAQQISKGWGFARIPRRGMQHVRVHPRYDVIKVEYLERTYDDSFRFYWE